MRRNNIADALGRTILVVFAVVVALGMMTACAPKKKPAVKKRSAPPATIEQKAPEQKPAKPRIGDQGVLTPERRASDSLIDSGNAKLAEGEPEKAVGIFRDAIKVDPSNGPAYYHLAFSYYKLQELEMARGSLEKAENLLRQDAEWSQKIDELKANLDSSY